MEIIKTRRSIDDSENKYRVKYKDGEHIGYEIVKYDELENYTLEKREKIFVDKLESKEFVLMLEKSEYRMYFIDEWDEDNNDYIIKKEKVENDIKNHPQLKQYIMYRNEEQGESIVFFEGILTEILF